MTVRYASSLATSSWWGSFNRLLFLWRGSVYKLIWREYLFFLGCYVLLSFVYQYGMTDNQQRAFEKFVKASKASSHRTEMSFVLGFFVTSIVRNYWSLYTLIPWPDSVALLVNFSIPGKSRPVHAIKKAILRYCHLNLLLTFRHISPPMQHKYPTLREVVNFGLLLENERVDLERMNNLAIYGNEWLPIKWAIELVKKAKMDNLIEGDFSCQRILDELDKFRHECAVLRDYDILSVPLVYIQVATLCVYTYFGSQLMASQWLMKREEAEREAFYFPFMTTIQFVFYMGWLKVAEALINPFGNDDDDFELEQIMERHIQISYLIIDADVDQECEVAVVPVTNFAVQNGNFVQYRSPHSPILTTALGDTHGIKTRSTGVFQSDFKKY